MSYYSLALTGHRDLEQKCNHKAEEVTEIILVKNNFVPLDDGILEW